MSSILTSSFLKTLQDCISNTTYNLSLSGSHQFHAERKYFALCKCSPILHKPSYSFFQKEWGLHWGHPWLHPSISSWQPQVLGRTGASLGQQCSRYLAAVAAGYNLNSPFKSKQEKLYHLLPAQPTFLSWMFPFRTMLDFQHSICSNTPTYSNIIEYYHCCSEDTLVLKFLCYPTALAFLCYWERYLEAAAAGFWASDTQNGVKGFSYLMTQFLQAKTPPMDNTEQSLQLSSSNRMRTTYQDSFWQTVALHAAPFIAAPVHSSCTALLPEAWLCTVLRICHPHSSRLPEHCWLLASKRHVI